MIVLDASVLIGFLNVDDHFHHPAIALLARAAGRPFRASAMTMAEVLVGPARTGRVAVAREGLTMLGVGVSVIGADSVERLASLRVRTQLKLPDCCVLLAAHDVGARAVASFDERLRHAAAEEGFDVLV